MDKTDNYQMKKIKDADIYPKFEFRLSHADKIWLQAELRSLKNKFNENADHSVITKNTLLIAALRHGISYLKSREKIGSKK